MPQYSEYAAKALADPKNGKPKIHNLNPIW